MSYEIERKKLCIKLNPKHKGSNENDYIAFIETGSNNIVPTDWGWSFVGYGWEYMIIGAVCRLGAEIESGTLKPHGKWSKPEAYIKKWREVIKNSFPFEETKGSINIKLAIKKEIFDNPTIKNEFENDKFKELIKKFNISEKLFYDASLKIANITLNTEEDVGNYVYLHNILKSNNMLYYENIEIR